MQDFENQKLQPALHLKNTPETNKFKSINTGSNPSSVDWRKQGAVNAVNNQGQCGSSIAFSVVDAVASFGAIYQWKLMDLSMQEFLDCCAKPNGSCSGGVIFDPLDGFECIGKLGGLETTESYPHQNETHKCRSDPSKIVVKVSGGSAVAAGDEVALAAAVAITPIAVMVDANRTSFQFYHTGVYSTANCSTTELDHSLLVVGYGEENGQAYWICKNSWGKEVLLDSCKCLC